MTKYWYKKRCIRFTLGKCLVESRPQRHSFMIYMFSLLYISKSIFLHFIFIQAVLQILQIFWFWTAKLILLHFCWLLSSGERELPPACGSPEWSTSPGGAVDCVRSRSRGIRLQRKNTHWPCQVRVILLDDSQNIH